MDDIMIHFEGRGADIKDLIDFFLRGSRPDDGSCSINLKRAYLSARQIIVGCVK